MKKILIMGLPGAGKTTLSNLLKVEMLKQHSVVHFNADEVRANINKDLGFSVEDRIENARRFGWLANKVKDGDAICICDFVCPTKEARKAFSPDIIIYVNTIKSGRFEDTNSLFDPPAPDEGYPIIEINHYLKEGIELS